MIQVGYKRKRKPCTRQLEFCVVSRPEQLWTPQQPCRKPSPLTHVVAARIMMHSIPVLLRFQHSNSCCLPKEHTLCPLFSTLANASKSINTPFGHFTHSYSLSFEDLLVLPLLTFNGQQHPRLQSKTTTQTETLKNDHIVHKSWSPESRDEFKIL